VSSPLAISNRVMPKPNPSTSDARAGLQQSGEADTATARGARLAADFARVDKAGTHRHGELVRRLFQTAFPGSPASIRMAKNWNAPMQKQILMQHTRGRIALKLSQSIRCRSFRVHAAKENEAGHGFASARLSAPLLSEAR
jgi:hypothetical protein